MAQAPDSILTQLEALISDSLKVDLLLEKSNAQVSRNQELSRLLAEEALKISEANGYQLRSALSYKAIALSWGYAGQPQNARSKYIKAAEIFGLLGDRLKVADMYMNSGVEFYYAGLYDSSMHYYLIALPVYEEIGDPTALGKIYNNLGNNYRVLGTKEKSINFYRKSLEKKESINDRSGVLNTSLNLGNLYRLADELDSALYFANIAQKLSEELNENHTLGLVYLLKGLINGDLRKYNEARKMMLQSETILQEHGNTASLASLYSSLATAYLHLDACDSAKIAISRFDELKTNLPLYREKKENAKVIAQCSAKSGDYTTAFEYQQLQLLYDDSVDVVEQQERLGELTLRYEESVRTSDLLEKKKLLAESQAKNNGLVALVFGSIAALLIAIFTIFVITQKNKRKRLANEEKIRRQVGEIERLRERLTSYSELTEEQKLAPMSLEEVNTHLINPLTERELEVLSFIAEGKSNQEIADQLFVSINTIKTHVNRIYDKLDVRNRTQATLKATELNLFK